MTGPVVRFTRRRASGDTFPDMPKLSSALVACLLVAAPLATTAPTPAEAARPRADLVTKRVTASYAAGMVTAAATIKNKGVKKAPVSRVSFYLSTDVRQSGDDTALGSARVRGLKPKRSKPVSGRFAVPASVAPGAYHVVVCADSGGAVKERKETNNCKGSAATLTITAGGSGPGSGPVTVAATAGVGGTVAASGVTGGSCVATTCTFPTSGTGTVTFTPTPAAGYRFGTWTGATCTGYTTGAGGKITFANPTTAKDCTATFVRQITISWTIAPVPLAVTGSVAGVASNGACSSDPVTGAGSCVVDASVGTVTLTGTAGVLPFKNWTGATCDGTAAANIMSFTAPAADKTCVANFGP